MRVVKRGFPVLPLPKRVAKLHNSRPATEAPVHPDPKQAGRTKRLLHRVLTFSETALRCAAPLDETAQAGDEGRLKKVPGRVLTEAEVAL